MANSDVYLNGELLGPPPATATSASSTKPGLHTSTPAPTCSPSASSDSQQPASRWYPGAGINRQVRLVTTGDAHIVPWGTFVIHPDLSALTPPYRPPALHQ